MSQPILQKDTLWCSNVYASVGGDNSARVLKFLWRIFVFALCDFVSLRLTKVDV
jgi:hypothetical protein